MISDLVIKAIVYHCVSDFNTSCEEVVQMPTHFIRVSMWVQCTLKPKEVQLLVHVVDVVVKVTTHHYVCIGILLDDMSNSLCSILLELLIIRFEIAV